MGHQEVAKPLRIKRNDFVAAGQKLGYQNMAFVTTTASDKNLHVIDPSILIIRLTISGPLLKSGLENTTEG